MRSERGFTNWTPDFDEEVSNAAARIGLEERTVQVGGGGFGEMHQGLNYGIQNPVKPRAI